MPSVGFVRRVHVCTRRMMGSTVCPHLRSEPQPSAPLGTTPKSMKDMPGLKKSAFIFPKIIWRIISNGGVYRMFYNVLENDLKMYGKIYTLFSLSNDKDEVFLANPADIKQVFATEDEFPNRGLVPALYAFFDEFKRKPGVFFSNDHQWKIYRDAVAKTMLRPRGMEPYTTDFDSIAIEFVTVLEKLRSKQEETLNEIPDLKFNLVKYAFESISEYLFDRRMGALKEQPPRDTIQFLKNVDCFMWNLIRIVLFPKYFDGIYRPKFIRDAFNSFDEIYSFAEDCIKKRLDEMILSNNSARNGREDGFIPSLLASSKSSEDILFIIVDIFFAGVDTTSNTLQWCLYELSKHPEVQDKLYQEIKMKLVECNGKLTYDAISEMTYLRSVIKETLRFYPALIMLTRVLPRDMVLSGYLIPKGIVINANMHSLSMSEEYYPDAKTFIPERWLRSNKTADPLASYTSMPFGHGVRMCVGRRVAEMEMSLVLARIIEKFQLTYPEGEVVEKIQRGITSPDRPMRIRFHCR